MRTTPSASLLVLCFAAGCSSSSATPLTPVPDATPDVATLDASADAAESLDDDTSIADAPGPEAPPKTPADPPIACPVVVPADALADKRTSCTFTTGARVSDTLGVSSAIAKSLPIRHVIVLMKENRSFDHMLGKLHEQRSDVEALPDTFANLDAANVSVPAFHTTTTCLPKDPNHQWDAMHHAINGGKMDGFVTSAGSTTGTDGHFVMSYNDATDLPFDYWLASTWPLNDHHFASARSGTYPNRLFMLLGTNDGVKQTALDYPDPATPTIFDTLNKAGVSWGVYTDGSILGGALNWSRSHPGVFTLAAFLKALDDGTLPNVAFVDGVDNLTDDHPDADLQKGEAWTKSVYDHALTSPQWQRLAMLWTYDEGGGFADHVPPPNTSCVARPGNAKDAAYVELGVRVPFAVISPWAKPNYVSHVAQEHTAITRFIETVFDLPAMTSRDANSGALLDMFDFSSCTPPMLKPPTAPAAGTKGCK
jgi:phospholipase C